MGHLRRALPFIVLPPLLVFVVLPGLSKADIGVFMQTPAYR